MSEKAAFRKIMWAIGYAPEKMGSFEETMIYMARESKKRNFKISFVFPDEPLHMLTQKLIESDAEVSKLPIKNRVDINFIRALISLLKKKRIDILHSHFDFANFPAAFSRCFYKSPLYFWHQHNLAGHRLPLMRKLFYNYLANQAGKVIAVSKAVKEDLVSKGFQDEKIEVIYNGVNLEKFALDYSKEAEGIRRELGIPQNSVILSCIGQGRPEKGQLFLLRAFHLIRNKYPNALLLLLGAKGGSYYGTLKEEAEELNIEKEVIFTEMRGGIPTLLYLTDIVIIPSLMEGLPYSALEAMAAKKPVIATKVGGLPEIIEHERTGILVPPGDAKAIAEAVLCLLSQDLLRKNIEKEGRRFVEEGNFTIEKMVQRVFDLYQRTD